MKLRTIILIFVCIAAIEALAQTETSVCQDMKALQEWVAGTCVSERAVQRFGIERCFTADTIDDATFRRINGKSFKDNPHISRSDLRYLRLLHVNNDGNICLGEMVCNKAISTDLTDIFRQLYDARYPIERMVLIDNYEADDEQSMRDNNSSCFCYRVVSGSKVLSHHARGMAVDINTLYNPYVKVRQDGSRYIQPGTAEPYTHRERTFIYKIQPTDICVQLFLSHGFKWGGNWNNPKDYQHFEK